MTLEKKLKSYRLLGRPPTLLNGTGKWVLRNVPRSIVPCPLCAGVTFRKLVSNDRYDMGIQTGRCCQCGLVMTNPVPHEETMRNFYKHHYRRYYRKAEIPTLQYIEEFGLRQRAEYTISYLQGKNLSLKNARILDVGCSEGSILKEIQERDPSVELVGIEPNESFANFARDFLNCKVYSNLAELSSKGESGFSLVIVNHVLEHVEDPVSFLKQLTRVLADNGCIYADVPDLSGYASLADFHIAHRYHFSIRTLSATAHKAQLRVAEMERHAPPYHPRSIRCLLKLQCEEPIWLRSELDDGPAYRRLKTINRWRWCYYIRQQVPTLGFRTARKAFRALAG